MIRIPIASDGWRFIIPLTLLSAGFIWLRQDWSLWLSGFLILAALFCAYFFRDFDRATKIDPSAVYSPGDGRILEVARLTEGEQKGKLLIRIFLSVLDGHVQRSPVDGKVSAVSYRKGIFLDARDPLAHVQNEQNIVTVSTSKGSIDVTQIAGLIARRIVCWVKVGDSLKQGERYGLIRFGSQVDLVLPVDVEPVVKVGDRVWGGSTVVARWRVA